MATIYRAYANGKEITDFPINGVETKEIWGGDTLLWKKKEDERTFSVTLYCTYPTSAFNTASGLDTDFMSDKVFHYNVYIEITGSLYSDNYGNRYSWAYYYKYHEEGFLEFQLILKAKSVSGFNIYKYVANDTRKQPNTEKKEVILQNYNLRKTNDGLYTINGTYNPVFLDDKDKNGKYLIKGFGAKSFASGGTYIERFTDINEAIKYVESFG